METTTYEKTIQLKDYKKRMRRNRRNRKILLILFLIAVLLMIAYLAPWFKINKITVEGNALIPSNTIIKASTIGYGRNVFKTSSKKAVKGISALPYIETAKIVKKFPAGIKIIVKECEVAGYVAFADSYIYIDSTGKMLEQNKVPPQKTVPLIENFNLTKYIAGQVFLSKDEGKAQYVTEVLGILKEQQMINSVTLINIPDPENLSIVIDNKLEVLVGANDNLQYKIEFLTLKSYQSLGENARGYLNVSSGDKAVYKQKG
ncbi:MAG: FtsQ-type POTRA domain-containing protein [Clostridia bacterium]|nr:FtsQ-type POTRA domain-containing protein [Clostridia bacterium]